MKFNYRTERIEGVEYKYSAEWIHELEAEEHWRLYWQQQKIMQNLIHSGDSVLEIGVGSGFTANYLKSKGVHVTTIDIDEDKQPDVVANIVEYPFHDSYDHLLAFEVFEHIPYDQFQLVMNKIGKIFKKNLFLSVPRNERAWVHMEFKLPRIKKKELRLATLKHRVAEPAHFWELDDGSISRAIFEQDLIASGLMIISRVKRFSRMFYTLQGSK